MKLTKRLNDFIKEVANVAVSEENSDVTYEECVTEYTDHFVLRMNQKIKYITRHGGYEGRKETK